MNKSEIRPILDAIGVAPNRRILWNLLLDFFASREIERISIHFRHRGEAATIRTVGFPTDWVCHYIEDDLAKVDPIPELAARMSEPFFWSEVGDLTDIDEAGQAYLKELEDADLGDGLAFCVFGPGGDQAYIGLGFGKGPVLRDRHAIFAYQIVAQAGFLRYCALIEERPAPQKALSPREIEVLRWIARGKSNSVIAQIMRISPHTVDTLVRRIYDKLGVSDRTTAAVQGLGSGLLQYSELDVA